MKFDSKQKFSIRKYSIGAASVLIGTFLVGGATSSGVAQADEVAEATSPSEASTTNQETTADLLETSATEGAAVSTSAEVSQEVSATTTSTAQEQEIATTSTAASEAATSEAASSTAVATSTVTVKVTETAPVTVDTTASTAANTPAQTAAEVQENAQVSEEDLSKLPKVVGLDTEAAVAHDDAGVVIPFTAEAQAQYQASLEAYMVTRRNNAGRRGSGFRNVGATSSQQDAEYEFKKVMTPVLPGYYADL